MLKSLLRALLSVMCRICSLAFCRCCYSRSPIIDNRSHHVGCVCELKLLAVRIFCVVFVFIRTVIQLVWQCRVVPSILKAVERCLWRTWNWTNEFYCRIHVFSFLKSIAVECMFRPVIKSQQENSLFSQCC